MFSGRPGAGLREGRPWRPWRDLGYASRSGSLRTEEQGPSGVYTWDMKLLSLALFLLSNTTDLTAKEREGEAGGRGLIA